MTENNILLFKSFRHKIALWFLWKLPSVLLVALCNSRAMGESTENSDIDLFIITKSGKIWTVRFLSTLLTNLLGVRRQNTHGLIKWTPEYIKKTKDKFCLSFFITEDGMNLDIIRIENDIYLNKWIESLLPLVNKDKTLEKFLKANSIEKFSKKEKKQKFPYFAFLRIEKIIKRLWLPKTVKTYERLWKPWWVVISETMLKFHDNDQRKIYRDIHRGT